MTRFDWLQEGDIITRVLSGYIPFKVQVVHVEGGRIYCCPPSLRWPVEECWVFDAITGSEIDERFNWGPPPLRSASYLVPINFIVRPTLDELILAIESRSLHVH